MEYKFEIIAFNIESCLAIQQGGADRIELCADPGSGGTTPSFGLIKTAREQVSIDLFPIIRPRGGDFLYSDEEFQVMMEDMMLCKTLECNGVVIGLLKKDGRIDTERTAKLIEAAYPLDVTFHRAFDRCIDPFEALEQLIDLGCKRILTSGQEWAAPQGAALITQLVKAAAGRISIMPGSGVRKENIKQLAEITGAVEFHSSLRNDVSGQMEFIHPAFKGSPENLYPAVRAADVEALRNALS